jgi:zinc protease
MTGKTGGLRRLPVPFYFLLCLLALHLTAIPATAGRTADREVLSNGLVLLHSEKTELPIVKVVVAVKAGSVVEPPSEPGLSNLTADLLNEGTAKRTSRQISDEIEFVGGQLSISGGRDYVTVSLTVLKKDVELGFDLLSDIIIHPSFSRDEIGRRKAIIKSSILRQKEDPGTIASKAFLKTVYGKHPYGRPVEGTEESLDSISRRDIVDFHDRYYAPNNAIMAVVGDLDRKETVSLINRHFRDWRRKDISGGVPDAPRPAKGRKVIRIDRNITQANIILGHLGIKRDNPDYYAVSVMNYILGGGGFASRLMDNIRDNRGLAYDVRSHFSADRYAGGFQVQLQTKNSSANTAIDEVFRELKRIRSKPVTDRELSDAKAYLTGSFPLRIDSISKMAGFLVAVEFYGLGLDYADRYSGFINSVTREDVLKVARRYLHPGDCVLVVVGDMKKALLRY